MEPIVDRKDKAAYVKIIQFDYFRKIRALGPSFPKLHEYPKYPKTSTTQPLDCLDTCVKPHLMWDVI